MKYYLIVIITYTDETQDKKAIHEYVNEYEAIAHFHSTMGTAMIQDNVESVLVVAMNSEGGIYKNEKFTKPTFVIEPEETK